MDEMKLRLSTKFMKGIIAKCIAKAIFNKTGRNVDVLLNEIEVKAVDGKMHIHVNVDAEITNEEFVKLIQSIGLD